MEAVSLAEVVSARVAPPASEKLMASIAARSQIFGLTDMFRGAPFWLPDCPSDAFATAASLAGSRVGWWQGAASSRVPAWPWMAAAPVKAPESLAESQMRQLDNQESHSHF